jgi:hypothetical protein
VNREEASDALKAFVSGCGASEFARTNALDAIESALNRYVNGRPGSEARECAKRLEKAADRYLRELLRADFFWHYMRFKAPEKPFGLAQPPVKFFGRDDWLPEHYDAALSAGLVRSAAKATAQALKKDKRGPNELRRGLGYDLAQIFSTLKGEPTFSNDASLEKPGTEFGYFVRLAILSSPLAHDPRLDRITNFFTSFVRDAASAFCGRVRSRGQRLEK